MSPDTGETRVQQLFAELGLPEELDTDLFLRALTHRSFANEKSLDYDNERLEFLGDAVLDIIVAEYLYRTYPNLREGRLSKIKSAVVKTQTLTRIARELGFDDHLRLSRGESQVERGLNKVVADCLEAFIGALYLSEGLEVTRSVFGPHFEEAINRYFEEGSRNFKGMLLEFTQERDLGTPEYHLEKVEGPQHRPVHYVTVTVQEECYGRGKGSTKKQAEQDAAQEALKALRDDSDSLNGNGS